MPSNNLKYSQMGPYAHQYMQYGGNMAYINHKPVHMHTCICNMPYIIHKRVRMPTSICICHILITKGSIGIPVYIICHMLLTNRSKRTPIYTKYAMYYPQMSPYAHQYVYAICPILIINESICTPVYAICHLLITKWVHVHTNICNIPYIY